MPVGTNATVKALDPDDLRRDRRPDHPVQHLPPGPATRARARSRTLGGLHEFMAWDRADPDRLGRLPGGQPGPAALDRRRRRHVPLPPRRLAPAVHAGARDRGPGGARRGHRGLLRSPGAPACLDAARRCWTRRSGRIAGRSAAWPRTRRPDQALFGIIQGGLEPDLRADSTACRRVACRSTGCASAGSPATRHPRSGAQRWTSWCRCSRTIRGHAT